MSVNLIRLFSLTSTRASLRSRPQWNSSTYLSKRYVQEFPGLRLDNSPPEDYFLVLPEKLDETGHNELLRIPQRGENEINFSKLDVETCFKGLSQVMCSFDDYITDFNNQTTSPHDSIRDIFKDIEKSLFPMDTAYNLLMISMSVDGQSYNYREIRSLMTRYIVNRERRLMGAFKTSLQSRVNSKEPLTASDRSMLRIYRINTRKPQGTRPLDQTSLFHHKDNLNTDIGYFTNNLSTANSLFSHTVDDPDILAAVSAEFDDCQDLHHRERTPLQVTPNTYHRFMRVCPDRFVRQMLWQTYNKRCSPKGLTKNNNLPIIKNMRVLRRKIADLSGYRSHLQYRLEDTMAASRQNVLESLTAINKENSVKLADRLDELYDYAVDNSFSDPGNVGFREYDIDYWSNKYMYDILIGLSESELKGFFPFKNVMQGLENYFRTYFSIDFKFQSNQEDKFWTNNTQFIELSRRGQPLGTIIYDPFIRSHDRPSDMYHARIRSRVQGAGHLPARLISTSFNLDPSTGQADLSVPDVVNLFYCFSTVIQRLLYNYQYYELNTYGALQEDVKNLLPNICNAHLLMDHKILQSCSNRTGSKPIDSELAGRILKALVYNRPFKTWFELYKAHLDLEAHVSLSDIKNLVAEAYSLYSPFPRDADNYDYCAMSDIFVGPHDGLYYGDLWSKQVANFCLSHVQDSNGRLDEDKTKKMLNSLVDSLFDPDNFDTDEKLVSLFGQRFEPSKSGLGVF